MSIASRCMLGCAILVLLISCAFTQEPSPTADISERRAFMLNLINSVRAQQNTGLVSLYLDTTLNDLAQRHSFDMVMNNYFSHINLQGQGPQQRAYAVGFSASVGQNIAYGVNLTSIHQALMNSPGHFANTINAQWTRAGIGIQQNMTTRLIFVTIMFSVRDFVRFPLTATELSTLKSKFVAYINEVNFNVVGTIPSKQDVTLSNHLTIWQNTSPKTSFFTYLQGKYFARSMSIAMDSRPYSANLVESLRASRRFWLSQPHYFTKFGYDLRVDATGNVKIWVAFAS